MTWSDSLLPDQRAAAEHAKGHARLIAGPGTGKTFVMTARVLDLVQSRGVPASEILVLTFTRAAAQELRERIAKALGEQAEQPKVATLHSFALRQLLRNSEKITSLPQPLRIADDWEERQVVVEDLKEILGQSVKEVKAEFQAMAADWESMDDSVLPRDPKFIGAWRQHRAVYGYTLRAELVYELKKALEQIADFKLDAPITHLLIDEYQDLNRCDLAIVRALATRGAVLFAAGDDDQSIYGFRKAYPEGIRRFLEEYAGSESLPLTVCVRCDSRILELATFVAELDPKRIPKELHAQDGQDGGDIALVQCKDQYDEAEGIARACKRLIVDRGYKPHEILILLRSDRYKAFSKPIVDALARESVPVASGEDDPLDEDAVRLVFSVLRLHLDPRDSLAWRTVLKLHKRNGIGDTAIAAVYERAVAEGKTFSAILTDLVPNPSAIPKFGAKLAAEHQTITGLLGILDELDKVAGPELLDSAATAQRFSVAINKVASVLIADASVAKQVSEALLDVAAQWYASNVKEFVAAVEAKDQDIEQVIKRNFVNILTMHRAKGLTAQAVFIAAAEDEYIPGRQTGEDEVGDERRLLYVSLTRAKHYLCITYCVRRLDQQANSGSTAGNQRRSLTRFLRDAGLTPVAKSQYAMMPPGV